MRNIWTIAKKEFSQYFISPVAYAVAFLVLGVVGLVFALNILQLSNSYGGATVPDSRPTTSLVVFLLIFFVPLLTMRLVADEVRMGTMELLLTAPLRDYELVIGKWLGSFLFVLLLIGITLIYPLILNSLIKPGIDQVMMLSGYLGLILVAAAFLGIGVGISAVFSNQIAAAFTTMAVLIVLMWLIGAPASLLPANGDVFRYLNVSDQFYGNFNSGLFSLSSTVYLLSLTALGLFIGTTAVEIRRWR